MVSCVFLLGCSSRPAPSPSSTSTPVPGAASTIADALPVFDEATDRKAREIIETLAEVKEEGLGYAGAYAGSEFLPYPKSGSAGMMLLQQAPPKPSSALGALVALGAPAVPALVACLTLERSTEIAPVKAMMWMSYSDEYDINRRTEPAPPKTVNREDSNTPLTPYQVTVGDLCFVALGQILNRHFNAVRYQPSGGLVVSSPPRSSALREVVTNRLAGFTAERHRASLMRDFREPDFDGRREGAALRLSFYYPAALEEVVLEILPRPTYDPFAVHRFARETLYREPDPAKRRALFDAFVREHGEAGKEGVMHILFHDLDMLEAHEQRRLHPPLTDFGTQPREILATLYGFGDKVVARDEPHVTYTPTSRLTDLVKLLRYDTSARIDEAVRKLAETTRDPDLQRACADRLARRAR